jgi:hypothetical protein
MIEKLLPQNEHNVERILRVGAGVGLLALLAVGPVPGWGLVGLVGLVPLATGILGSCPAYTLLGLSTRSAKVTQPEA